MDDFNVGDAVRLKSGGPPMTIDGIDDYSMAPTGRKQARCVWFDGAKRMSAVFELPNLERSKPDMDYSSLDVIAVCQGLPFLPRRPPRKSQLKS